MPRFRVPRESVTLGKLVALSKCRANVEKRSFHHSEPLPGETRPTRAPLERDATAWCQRQLSFCQRARERRDMAVAKAENSWHSASATSFPPRVLGTPFRGMAHLPQHGWSEGGAQPSPNGKLPTNWKGERRGKSRRDQTGRGRAQDPSSTSVCPSRSENSWH